MLRELTQCIDFEKVKWNAFCAEYNSGEFDGQRFGQAFIGHFDIARSPNANELLDPAYNMDNDSARRYLLSVLNLN